MFSDSICDGTWMEFEMGYPDMGTSRHNSISSGINTYDCVNRDQRFGPQRGQLNPMAIYQHEYKSHIATNSSVHPPSIYPWQNIGDRTEHLDLYQRYTLDTRFVPEQYRAFVDTLMHPQFVETECLAQQKIFIAPKVPIAGTKQPPEGIVNEACLAWAKQHELQMRYGSESQTQYSGNNMHQPRPSDDANLPVSQPESRKEHGEIAIIQVARTVQSGTCSSSVTDNQSHTSKIINNQSQPCVEEINQSENVTTGETNSLLGYAKNILKKGMVLGAILLCFI